MGRKLKRYVQQIRVEWRPQVVGPTVRFLRTYRKEHHYTPTRASWMRLQRCLGRTVGMDRSAFIDMHPNRGMDVIWFVEAAVRKA